MTLLICPVRPGDSNQELRYALRSWETNLLLPGGLYLVTVGYQPTWLSPDLHIPGNRQDSVPLAVFDNIWLGAKHLANQHLSRYEPALFMNDDFFCLDPTGAVLPVKRNQSLANHVHYIGGRAGGLWWHRSMALTAAWLAERGYADPDSYEVHRPFVASPYAMVAALSEVAQGLGVDPLVDMVPQWRTLCGVLNQMKAYPVADPKVLPGNYQIPYGSPWISTDDQSWNLGLSQTIGQRFQKPSRWECG